MKIDMYSRVMLSIIALCLSVQVLRQVDLIPSAHAHEPVQPLSYSAGYALVPVNADGSIDVHIKSVSSTVEVDLVGISTTDELEVNIEEVGGHSVYRALPVKIQ